MNNYTILIIILVLILIGGGVAAAIVLTGKKSSSSQTGNATYGIFSNQYYGIANGSDYDSAIQVASQRWSRYINENINIPIRYETFNNPFSSTLARASMNTGSDIRAGGTIEINTAKSTPPAGWDDVIEHEIGHVLGLPGSTKWTNAVISSGGNSYLDANKFPLTAQAYYDLIPGATGNIPLQDGGYHWDEATFTTELMTPSIGSELELITSKLTLTAMQEIGWSIDLTQAENF